MFEFGDYVIFSDAWFVANQAKDKEWIEKTKNMVMIVAGQKGASVTVIRKGTRYAHRYHYSFLINQ